MKKLLGVLHPFTVAVGIVMALFGSPAWAQNYYSLQHTNWPPLPFLPFNVEVFDLGDGFLAYDDLAVDYGQEAMTDSGPPMPGEGGGGTNEVVNLPSAYNYMTNDLWVEIVLVTNNDVSLIIHAPDTNAYDLYRTFELIGNHATNSVWRWVGKGTNGQSLTFLNVRCRHAFYMLGSGVDSDSDGLSNPFEVLSSKTSPGTNHTYSAEWTDLEWWLRSNILVNDPEQDCETEQNTQDETTLIAFSNTVIVAWVDSNLGVPGYGGVDPACGVNGWYPPRPPEFIGWAVSRDRGASFMDKGSVPMFSNVVAFVITNYPDEGYFATTNLGNAGDPVLTRDTTSGTIYLTGNPQRPSVYYPEGTNASAKLYVPLWRSTNDGETFLPPINIIPGLVPTNTTSDVADKPALIVDNFPGEGQGDVYLAILWIGGSSGLIVSKSTSGGANWQVLHAGLGATGAARPSFAVTTNTIDGKHEVCLLWVNNTTRQMLFSKSADRGTNFSSPSVAVSLTNASAGFSLTRSNSSSSEDSFRAPIIPTLAANPANGDLYVVYHDSPSNSVSHPNIYFLQSTDGGTNWSERIQVNVETNSTPTDQWQPTITVKPDGTELFIAWYDRRDDPTNNSLIRTYGVLADLPITNANSFAAAFAISSVHFPPVFSGTTMTNLGQFDPVYPPPTRNDGMACPTFFGIYAGHMGDYDAAVSDNAHIYYSWADNRDKSTNSVSGINRNQADIRFVRIPW